VFGLFTRLGGPAAAIATLLAGMLTYLVGSYSGLTAPYLLSLAVSLATYLMVAMLERSSAAGRREDSLA
jgi:hypothetical protein